MKKSLDSRKKFQYFFKTICILSPFLMTCLIIRSLDRIYFEGPLVRYIPNTDVFLFFFDTWIPFVHSKLCNLYSFRKETRSNFLCFFETLLQRRFIDTIFYFGPTKQYPGQVGVAAGSCTWAAKRPTLSTTCSVSWLNMRTDRRSKKKKKIKI